MQWVQKLDKNFHSSIVSFISVAFFFVSTLGVCFAMQMNHGNFMSPCPFMGHSAALCPMEGVNAITSWQQFFVALPATFSFILLIALFVSAIVVYTAHTLGESPQLRQARWYAKEHPNIPLYNFLLHLFSRGILQPKLYA